MANLTKLLLLSFAVYLSVVITGVVDLPGATIYSFLTTDTIDWSLNSFLGFLSDLFLVGGGLAVAVGYVFERKYLINAGVASAFISYGMIFTELKSVIEAQTNEIIGWIFISPFVLIYVMTIISFWRERAD